MTGAALLLPLALAALQADPGDARSRELVRYDCVSALGSDSLTLFANGTVRSRQRGPERDELRLLELDPEQLQAFRNRLRAEDLSEAESPRFGPVGEWIDQCTLDLRLEGKPPRRFRFGRYDTLSLNLSRVLAVVDDLASQVAALPATSGLPPGYRPEPGHLLERRDGQLYEVVGLTADGNGVELRNVDQPLLLFLPLDALRAEFLRRIQEPD